MAPSVTLIRKIFENAFTMGLVTSLAKPQRAKHEVIMRKGMRKLTPSLVSKPLSFLGSSPLLSIFVGFCYLS